MSPDAEPCNLQIYACVFSSSSRSAEFSNLIALAREPANDRTRYRAPNTDKPATFRRIHDASELFVGFAYECTSVLIADVAELIKGIETLSHPSSLDAVLAGWDAALLLVDPARIGPSAMSDLRDVLSGTLAPRLAVAAYDTTSDVLTLQLVRLLATGGQQPRSLARVLLGATRMAFYKLPPRWVWVWSQAMSAPHSWTVKRISVECGVSRRTLEREHQRCGLPTPAVMLGHSRRA